MERGKNCAKIDDDVVYGSSLIPLQLVIPPDNFKELLQKFSMSVDPKG